MKFSTLAAAIFEKNIRFSSEYKIKFVNQVVNWPERRVEEGCMKEGNRLISCTLFDMVEQVPRSGDGMFLYTAYPENTLLKEKHRQSSNPAQ